MAGLKVKYLAFADDLVLMAETEEEIIRQIEELRETDEKASLQMSFKKSEVVPIFKKYPNKEIVTKYGTLKEVSEF